MKKYLAEIINIGDELLAGHTVNSNAARISRALRSVGIPTLRQTVIPDEKKAIDDCLDNILPETTHVFITGGLGPTGDDRTKAVLTAYFGGKLVYMPDIYAEIETLFRARGRVPSAANREQAYEPDNAELIPNSMGTAKGLIFRSGKRSYYVMPGVPYEMESMLHNEILPELRTLTGIRELELQINTFGLPESELSDRINEAFPNIEREIILGYYPSVEGITLRLRGKDPKRVLHYSKAISALLPEVVYSTTGESIAELLLRLCEKKHCSLVTAESCTGGLISSMITDIPGSSAVFRRGYVVYSNQAKIDMLSVSPDLLTEHGAVSEVCVKTMAENALKNMECGLSIAVSGIAGPSGATEGKPVGTTWIAVAFGKRLYSKKINFDRGRLNNKKYAANTALHFAYRILKDEKDC